jgi:enhancing lycopene biosynthesis protein 2
MRIGVLLGGCGLYDGSDPQETVLTLLALEKMGEKPLLIAPDVAQDRTVDHLTGAAVEGETRGVLRESARLVRGVVRPLGECRPQDLEALIIPGGYGPVVNFATGFARAGEGRMLLPEVAAFLGHFLQSGKPIGCVGLGEIPVRMALGQEAEIDALPRDPARPRIDADRPIVHTPGFVIFTRLADVKAGIDAMVEEVVRRVGEPGRRDAPAGARSGT